MGIFIVKSKIGAEPNPDSKIVKDDKELKIILFLCQSFENRN